jgi:hypothetical protein
MKFWSFRPSLGIFCGKTIRPRDLKFGGLEDSILPYNIYFLQEKLSTKFITINFWKWTKIKLFKVSQGGPLTSHAHQIWQTSRTPDPWPCGPKIRPRPLPVCPQGVSENLNNFRFFKIFWWKIHPRDVTWDPYQIDGGTLGYKMYFFEENYIRGIFVGAGRKKKFQKFLWGDPDKPRPPYLTQP